MKTMQTNLITLSCLFVCIRTTAQIFTVTSNPIWTDTGIALSTGDTVSITAQASWTSGWYGGQVLLGPDGVPNTLNYYDDFLSSANNAELIAYVGSDPYQGHWGDGTFFPRSTGYWAIGSNGGLTAAESGELWLGMNDDAVSKSISDNIGTAQATVEIVPVPEPSVFCFAALALVAVVHRCANCPTKCPASWSAARSFHR